MKTTLSTVLAIVCATGWVTAADKSGPADSRSAEDIILGKLMRPIPADSPTLRYVQSERDGLVSNALPLAVGEMPEAPEAEPNDSAAKANKIETPVTVNGRIGQIGDVDCFAFSVEAQQKLMMEVRARRLDSPLDSIIALFDSKGQELAADDDTVDLGAGLAIHHADLQLVYTFPSAGDYVLKLRDAQSKGGEEYAYRLTVAAPRGDFLVQITPDNPRLGQGGSATLTVTVAPAKSEAKITVTASVEAPVGLMESIIITGDMQVGKETFSDVAPAISVKVVAPKSKRMKGV